MQWLFFILVALAFVLISGLGLWALPMGGAQFVLVFSCLFISVVLCDLALLSQRLERLRRHMPCPRASQAA